MNQPRQNYMNLKYSLMIKGEIDKLLEYGFEQPNLGHWLFGQPLIYPYFIIFSSDYLCNSLKA
jgi:hypothetical protein